MVRKAIEEELCALLGMRAERKGRPQQVACYRAGDEVGTRVGFGGEERE